MIKSKEPSLIATISIIVGVYIFAIYNVRVCVCVHARACVRVCVCLGGGGWKINIRTYIKGQSMDHSYLLKCRPALYMPCRQILNILTLTFESNVISAVRNHC